MKLNEYQELTTKTDGYLTIYKTADVIPPYVYYALGLAGEAGETVDQIKKLCRDGGIEHIDPERADKILYELGDCLWYLARLADSLGFSLDTIALANIDKLTARYERIKREKKK